MSVMLRWVCGGGPGDRAASEVSDRKNVPPVISLFALIVMVFGPMARDSPSPGPKSVPSISGAVRASGDVTFGTDHEVGEGRDARLASGWGRGHTRRQA